jgi:hypothetical protein
MEMKKIGAALHQDDLGRAFSDRIAEFRPFAYYDKHLDCVRVHLHDCSAVEVRKTRIFTVMRALHSNGNVVQDDFVGFNIKGVRHLFREVGLAFMDRQACVMVADALSAIVARFPDKDGREVEAKVLPFLQKHGIQIEWEQEPEPALA